MDLTGPHLEVRPVRVAGGTHGGRGRFRFTGSAESAQVAGDMVSVSRGSTRGEDSVRPDEREAAAKISVNDIDELGVAPDADRLERAADTGARHDQHVASAAEQVIQPGWSVPATDLEVGEPVSGLGPRP